MGALACAVLALGACAAEVPGGLESTPEALSADAQELAFTELVDPAGIGTAGERKTRVLIGSARGYERLFGHAPPAGVDFTAGDAVIFYSAGLKRTGGYDASVQQVVLRSHVLHVTTELESPGAGCIVTQALSKPAVLAKVRLPTWVLRTRFHSRHSVRDCSEPPAFCGGIAGFPCPDGQQCIDDPSDDCDPQMGGADCGGICVPITDPCASVRCRAGTTCQVNSEGNAECVPDPDQDPCAAVRCRAGTECQVNAEGNVECVAVGPFCGGIAARPCPGNGECIDNPVDGCDPNAGGADCGGVCICARTTVCRAGSQFDSSPDVCACVPVSPSPCATVLCRAGTRCEVHDGAAVCVSDGSAACGPTTCGEGLTCCNGSCGICTPPGTFCTQQACL